MSDVRPYLPSCHTIVVTITTMTILSAISCQLMVVCHIRFAMNGQASGKRSKRSSASMVYPPFFGYARDGNHHAPLLKTILPYTYNKVKLTPSGGGQKNT